MQHSVDDILELLDEKTSNTKSSQKFAQTVQIIFSEPNSLVQKMNHLKTKKIIPLSPSKKDKQNTLLFNRVKQQGEFDVDSISTIYSNVKKHGLGTRKAMVQKFQEPQGLHKYVKSRTDMKLFFIMVLWDQLFTQAANKILLIRVLNLINSCPGYIKVFETWATEFRQEYLTLMMAQLHTYMQAEFEKLHPEVLSNENLAKMLWLNISILAKFGGILYRSNAEAHRVPKELFVSPTLSKYFDPVNQYKRYYKQVVQFNMIPFAYLMDLSYKNELLHIQSVLEQKLNIQKTMSQGINAMINSMLNNGGGIEELIYLHFEVKRDNLLDDSMQKLGKAKQNLKSPLRISFVGEQGSDEGGVKNEYFQLITKQIFNPYLDMFLPRNNGRVYWFNGFSFEPPIRFQFVGMLLGLAIYNSVHLNIPFPDVLYKKLLNRNAQGQDYYGPELLDDLYGLEPEVYKSMKNILDTNEPLDELELFFTIQLESFGQKIVEELVGDGRQIRVTQDNKHEYAQLYADYLINKQVAKQFTAFKKGFQKVVSGKMIEVFLCLHNLFQLLDPVDLKTIIYGNQVIDFKELQENTVYEGGYSVDTPVIKNLWEVLHSLSIEDKKAFLIFATGSDRVPIEGLKSLEFVVQKHANTSSLPSAHTCFNVFLLPEYESKEKLQKMIEIILRNNQGFGLI